MNTNAYGSVEMSGFVNDSFRFSVYESFIVWESMEYVESVSGRLRTEYAETVPTSIG